MRTGLFWMVLLLGILISSPAQALAGQEEKEETVNEKIKIAKNYENKGDFAQAATLFEELLKKNPSNQRLYDEYVKALIKKGDYDKALEVHRSGILPGDEWQGKARTLKREKTAEEKAMKNFAAAMKNQPPWAQATKSSAPGLEITTNIPETYSSELGKDVKKLVVEEKKMLEAILGPAKGEPPFLKMVVAGRPDEYKSILSGKDFPGNVLASGAYDAKTKTLVIFFNGTTDRRVIAHELVHYLLRTLYTQQPSPFLEEGLADYVAYKSVKKKAQPAIVEMLDSLHTFYDQGRLSSAMGLFPAWEHYELFPADETGKQEFYLRAWSLVAFFLDGEAPFFKRFFHDYAAYEANLGPLSRKEVETYFRANLSEEQIHELDKKWHRFIAQMTYDNI